MKLNIIKNSKYFYLFSGTLLLISLLSLIAWGLKPGIDFTGGSFLELNFTDQRPANDELQKSLAGLDLGELIFSAAWGVAASLKITTRTKPISGLAKTLPSPAKDIVLPVTGIFNLS